MLVAVEYGTKKDFKNSVCNYRDNWNRYHKSPDDDDIGLREAFRRICVQMYRWALDLFQTLPNYTGQRAIICYSFVRLADNIGQLLRTNRPDRSPISAGMRTRALRCAVPAMQELEGDNKDFIGASHYLMTVFESVQCQQTVKGVLPHTQLESERHYAEQRTILRALREHGDMRTTVKGHPSPVSLREGRTLVLPPELYDAFYQPSLMAPPARREFPRKGMQGRGDGSSAQVDPFVTPAPAPGVTAALKRMDNRVATFSETQEGSATEWESEVDEAVVHTHVGMRAAGMSDEDWGEEDLDMGYHPTSDVADEPPEVDDEEIEGAQGALPPDGRPREGVKIQTETTVETAQNPLADEIMRAESQYGDAGTEDRILDDAVDDGKDNDFNTVVEETYYEQGEEELDYDDDAPAEESTPAHLDDDNADEEEEDVPTNTELVCPKKQKDAPVWGRLGTPVGNRSTTDTEAGETTELMQSVLLGSPQGDPIEEESRPRRSRRSDKESTVLSDSSRRSRGHSSDSSRSSCHSTGSKRRHDQKVKPSEEPSTLNVPEPTTPRQSPRQKQIKMTEPPSKTTTSTPTVSSVVQFAEMPAQDHMRARLNDMERRITGVTGEPSPPSSRSRRRSDTGLRPNRPRYPMTQRLRVKQMETLCIDNRDEYIYRMTYEINMERYAHFTEDLKVLGSNAEEMIRQVIATCVWGYEFNRLTGQIEVPYLPYLLWSPTPRVEGWRTPTIRPGKCNDHRAEVKRGWRYLVVLLQFWMDNNATIRIRGSPVRPMSPLSNVVKETANLILPECFRIYWKNVVEDTPWYLHRIYANLIAVSPEPVNRLEKAMKLYHEKTSEILEKTRAKRREWTPRSPAAESSHMRPLVEDKVVAGQFDDENLGQDVIDPLETPTTTPVQDEETATTGQSEPPVAEEAPSSQNASTPQSTRRFPTFTSPSYRQEEIASQGDPADMPELLPRTPGTTPKNTPGPSPRTTPRVTPISSPNRPSPVVSSLRGRHRGAVNSPSGRGRGTPLPP